MSVAEARALDQVAKFTPKGWENKVRQLLVEAKNTGTIAGWWRDKDRSTPAENRRRMKGKLDFEAWLSIDDGNPLSSPYKRLLEYLPRWKQTGIQVALMSEPWVSFTLDIECKTGRGKLNEAQEQAVERSMQNPGRHPFVVYPTDLPSLRMVLGI